MPEIQEFTAAFLDAFSGELAQRVPGAMSVAWNLAETGLPGEPLTWWSARPGSDSEAMVFIGTPGELVQEFGGAGESDDPQDNYFAQLTQTLQSTFEQLIGADATVEDSGAAGDPPPDWLVVNFEISDDLARRELYCVLSPALERLLQPEPEEAPAPVFSGASASMDLLMHVQVPVSVCFGRAKVRMRDLLSYTPGAIVELDQNLGDAVEIRVNNCVIARGEVVAVDGNYGVRVLELASANGAVNILPVAAEAR